MSQNNGTAPKCPSVKRLREISEKTNSWLIEMSENELAGEVTNALEWLATFLENRNLYHKRQQLKNKHLMRLAKEHGLFDESAKKQVDAELFNHVANQQGEEDE